MKSNVTYVDASKLEAICIKRGARMTVQAGFTKVSGAKGRNLYIAKTKRIGRVDISGFTITGPSVKNLGGESFGAVKQQLNFSLPENDILANFDELVATMLSLEASVPKKKTPPILNRKVAAKKMSEHIPVSSTAEADAIRLALIKKVAGEKGVKVAEATIVALTSSLMNTVAVV